MNAKNLETLGAERLAALLIEISTGSAASKRRLRLELAGAQSVEEVAREVRKRLSSIERSRTVINWRKIKALVKDLETQRSVIVGTIAEGDPDEAMELLWRFLELASPIFARCETSTDTIIECFHAACLDLGAVALKCSAKQLQRLPDQILAALMRDDEYQYAPLVESVAPVLGSQGLEKLQSLLQDALREQAEPSATRSVAGYGSGGPVYKDEIEVRHGQGIIRRALEHIADALGDVDAYIAQQGEKALTLPEVGAEIAGRLLKAGRTDEALKALDRASPSGPLRMHEFEWQDARCNVLEALGRQQQAQEFRLQCFEQSLNPEHLRAYLKRLPDFDDMEAEERALDFVLKVGEIHMGLHFLIDWPALAHAARLIVDRASEIDGDHYETLTRAAEALQVRHPLAATILLRAMIDFALDHARSSRYRYAARHLAECAALAANLTDFGTFTDHQTYVARLRADHGRKHGFWSAVR